MAYEIENSIQHSIPSSKASALGIEAVQHNGLPTRTDKTLKIPSNLIFTYSIVKCIILFIQQNKIDEEKDFF